MQCDDLTALAAWTVCTEPGDEFAGALRATLGSTKSLELLMQKNASAISKAFELHGDADAVTNRFGDPELVARDALERWWPRLRGSNVADALKSVESGRFRLVGPNDSPWPHGLESLGWGAPAALWVAGNPESLAETDRSVALVGSRTATNYGQFVTQELVSGLAENHYAVVSGGAFGIDALAHQSSLALDNTTIAIMAGGLDRIYPSSNRELLEKIAERWALVSEMPPGSSPTKWRFLQRNRLIAAMSSATVVVEAGWRSGSINTANHANTIGRAVGAVPGPITSPSSAGCHRLIRENKANIVTCADDVRELMGEGVGLFTSDEETLGPLEKRAIDALLRKWQPLELVATQAGLTQGEAKIALTSLEIDGLAETSLLGWRRTGSNL